MPKKDKGLKMNGNITIEIGELYTRTVKATGGGAMLNFKKKYLGKKVYIIVPKELVDEEDD